MQALDLVQLDGAELPRWAAFISRLDELLGRLREHDLRPLLVALVAALIHEDRVLQPLQGQGVADVLPAIGHDRHTRRWDVERDLGALDDDLPPDGQVGWGCSYRDRRLSA